MSNKLLARLFEAILQQDDKDFIEIYEQIVALLQEAKDDYINLRLQANEDNAVILNWLAKEAAEEVGGDWWAFTWLQDYAHRGQGNDDDTDEDIIDMAKDTFAQLDKDLDDALQADADALEVADDADELKHMTISALKYQSIYQAYEAQQKAGEGDDLEKTDPDDDGVWHSFVLLHDDDYEAWVKADEDKDDE